MALGIIVGGISPLTVPPKPQHTIPIGIIGDGYTALAFGYHALRAGIAHDAMMVFGPGILGHGRAYGTAHDDYRLNVRADLMRLDPNTPDDFPNWAATNIDDPSAKTDAGWFYRRRDFARYLTDRLTDQLNTSTGGHPIPQHRHHVTAITPSPDGWCVWAGDKKLAQCRQLILATGNPPTTPPFALPPSLAGRVISAPWLGTGYDDIAPQHHHTDEHITIIGGGLTGLDAVTALVNTNAAHITMVTPGGHLPPPQLNWVPGRSNGAKWRNPKTAAAFAQIFLQQLDHHALDDVIMQEQFEHLRRDFNAHWTALSLHDRERLLARLGWLWQKIRFRSTPHAAAAITTLTAQGRFTMIAGRVTALTDHDGGAQLTLDDTTTITTDRVILATGRGHDALLDRLMADGHASHPFQTDKHHRVITPTGPGSLFALGPPTMISQGDVMGASTIAALAHNLAHDLAHNLAHDLAHHPARPHKGITS